jgi:hypothetical protein
MPTVTNPDTDPEQALRQLYRARRTPEFVEVPELSFLMIDGHGDPNHSERYRQAVQALYAVSYRLKFALKKQRGLAWRVAPLEGLWWAQDMTRFSSQRKADWDWTMMIRQPAQVSPQLVEQAAQEVADNKQLAAARELRLERFTEGPAAQVLHLGPYSAEGPTIAALHAFLHEHGRRFDGRCHKHHEIYLSDPRRTAPERLKTMIRQPVSPA